MSAVLVVHLVLALSASPARFEVPVSVGAGRPAVRLLDTGLGLVVLPRATPGRRDGETADFALWVRAGRDCEPRDDLDLAALTAHLVVAAGTATDGSRDEVDRRCRELGLELHATLRDDRVEISGRVSPATDGDGGAGDSRLLQALALLFRKVSEPRITEAEFTAVRDQLLPDSASRRSDRAQRELAARALGPRHPACRVARGAKGASLAQATEFFRSSYAPGRALLTVWTRGDPAALLESVVPVASTWRADAERYSGPDHSGRRSPPTIAWLPAAGGERRLLLGRAVPFSRGSSELPLVRLLVEALRPRMPEIRVTLQLPDRGEGLLVCSSSGAAPVAILDRALEVLGSLRATVLSAEEFAVLRKAVVEDLDAAPPDDLDRIACLFAGYDFGLHTRELERLRRVTARELTDLARSLFDPALFHAVVLCDDDPEEIGLTKYGVPVEKISRVSPIALEGGQQLLARVVEAAGGSQRLSALRGLSWNSLELRGDPPVEVTSEAVVLFPDRLRVTVRDRGGGTQTTLLVADRAWRWSGEEVLELPPAQVQSLRRGLALATLSLLRVHDEIIAEELPSERLGGDECRVLRITRPGVASVDFLVEPETYRIAYRRNVFAGARDTVRREEWLGDYRPVEGIWLPHDRTIDIDGRRTFVIHAREYRLDPPVDVGTFAPPGGDG